MKVKTFVVIEDIVSGENPTGGDYFGFFKEFLILKFRYIKDNTAPVPYQNFGLTFWTCS